MECCGLLPANPPTSQCSHLVHQVCLQSRDRTQPLVALHPLLPPSSLVSLCPPLICCQQRSSSSSPFQVIEMLALLCLETSSLLRSLKVKGGVFTGSSKIRQDLGLPSQHTLSLGLPRTVPSSHRPPSHSVTHSMRQPLGLCACSSLCLECSCPDSLVIYSWVLFRPLFKCRAEKLSLHPNRNRRPSSAVCPPAGFSQYFLPPDIL